ncbi:MAG: hypothetical protein R6T91_04535, partial [Bacteroidales bacterium]
MGLFGAQNLDVFFRADFHKIDMGAAGDAVAEKKPGGSLEGGVVYASFYDGLVAGAFRSRQGKVLQRHFYILGQGRAFHVLTGSSA